MSILNCKLELYTYFFAKFSKVQCYLQSTQFQDKDEGLVIIVSAWLKTHNLRVWEMEKSTIFWPKDNYLLKRHGPKHMEKSVAVGMTIFYGSLFLLGVPGNFLTCLIIFMNSYMRAAPNYYLFNLAVADILTLSIGKLYFTFLIASSPKQSKKLLFILSFCVNPCHFVSI